ncbi:MAG: hypothetical protein U0168_00035 [Nannocystaceae bacterium]
MLTQEAELASAAAARFLEQRLGVDGDQDLGAGSRSRSRAATTSRRSCSTVW